MECKGTMSSQFHAFDCCSLRLVDITLLTSILEQIGDEQQTFGAEKPNSAVKAWQDKA